MRTFYYLISVIYLCLLIGCRNNSKINYSPPIFTEEHNVELNVITDSLLVNYISDIEIYNNKLIINSLIDNKFIHIIDSKTGEFLFNGIGRGRSKDEIVMASSISVNHDNGDILITDGNTSDKVLCYNIDSLVNGNLFNVPIEVAKGNVPSEIFWAKNGFLYYERIPNRALKVLRTTKDDGSLSILEDIPIEDSVVWHVIETQRKIAVSKDKNRLIIGNLVGAILEIYDISDGVKKSDTKYFIEPLINKAKNDFSEDATLGFVDMYATEKYIYTIYSGDKENTPINTIAIFDLKGNPVLKYVLNPSVILMQLCVDESNKMIYVAGLDQDYKYFIGYINMK